MASYPTQLRVGYVGSGGQWIWLQKVLTFMLMMILVVVRCSGNVKPKKPEDCHVYHIESGMGSPAFKFEEKFTIGFLPQNSTDALAGVSLQMATNQGKTTIHFSTTNALQSQCAYNDTKKKKENGKLLQLNKSDRHFQWVHIPMSLTEGLININQAKNVCPNDTLLGNNKIFRISRTEFPTNVVFNCQEGCPIFSDSIAISEYKSNENTLHEKEIYFRKTKDAGTKNASASLEVKICDSEQSKTCQLLSNITLLNKTVTETWQKLAFNDHHLQNEPTKRYAELKVGDGIIWNYVNDTPAFKPRLLLKSSEWVDWAIGCDPRKNETKDDNPRSESQKNKDPILLLLIVLLTISVLGNILYTAIFCTSRKRTANENRVENVDSDMGSGGGPTYRPPTPLPNSSASPPPSSSLTQSPPNNQPGDPAYIYDDPEELMRGLVNPPTRNGSSSNSADPINNRPRMPSPTEERNLTFSGAPEEDENAYCYIDREVLMEQLKKDKEEEERRMRDAASGEGAQLSRHESVNSLCEELKMTDSGQ